MTSGRPSGIRGPRGAAPPPPTWLSGIRLPIEVLPAGTVFHRIHRMTFEPVFFGPGAGVPPTYRFDSGSGQFGVLYVGLSCAGAIAETLLRNPNRLMVAAAEIADRAATELICRRAVRVVKLYGAGLQNVGTDNAISTGPYEPCGLWSDALWSHSDSPDGIAYQSRHDSDELCIAFFQRPDMEFEVKATRPLMTMLNEVAALLDRYGKSLSPG